MLLLQASSAAMAKPPCVPLASVHCLCNGDISMALPRGGIIRTRVYLKYPECLSWTSSELFHVYCRTAQFRLKDLMIQVYKLRGSKQQTTAQTFGWVGSTPVPAAVFRAALPPALP